MLVVLSKELFPGVVDADEGDDGVVHGAPERVAVLPQPIHRTQDLLAVFELSEKGITMF